MRPVERGYCPTNSVGKRITFSRYKNARGQLIRRLGEVCSYCEMHLDASLAVEHVRPKQPPGFNAPIPQRELSWSNMLLACTNCNSTKSNQEINPADYVLPDRDNTFLALIYKSGGLVEAAPGAMKTRAENTIRLVGLDYVPTRAEQAKDASDRRWNNRREAWDVATRSRDRLTRNDCDEMREQIVETIYGYWSVWMAVFSGDSDMLGRIIRKIPGTAIDCFDPAQGYIPIPRPSRYKICAVK